MKITDILKEDGDTSGDYQKMLAFANANRVGGVPDDQQIPLALFKEIQKQRQQNQALSAELSDAEKRINQALSTGELSKRELGMHAAELERERTAGQKQQAAIGQMGQQYSERERASTEQMQRLRGQLKTIKDKPGVDQKAAEELEQQIKELSKKSVPADRIAELERTIAQVQTSSIADDSAIKDLVSQVNAAQKATQELEKTKQTVGRNAEQMAADAITQLAQIKQELKHFKEVEQNVATLAKEVNHLELEYDDTTKSLMDLEQDVYRLDTIVAAKNRTATVNMMKQTPQDVLAKTQQIPAPSPRDIGQSLVAKGVVTPPAKPVAESAFARSIAWATGRTK